MERYSARERPAAAPGAPAPRHPAGRCSILIAALGGRARGVPAALAARRRRCGRRDLNEGGPVKPALDQLATVRVLVVGDLMVDRYQWGQVERISPEAPVPIVRVVREERRPGGAANVANNLRALGCRVGVGGVVGEDEAGAALLAMLDALGIERGGVLRVPGRPTTEKLRIMGHEQQLLRVDREERTPLPPREPDRLCAC